jgi:small subunit ribosomal protein S15
MNKKTPQAVINNGIIKEAVKKWQHHDNDYGSAEVQIAALSERVKYLTRHLLSNTHDNSAKRSLDLIVNQRRKLLNYLYDNNRPKADELIRELGIRFRPPGRAWDKEARYGAFKNTKSAIGKLKLAARISANAKA